jgi:nickel-dependent lactate racemase
VATVKLDYGRSSIAVEVPADADVIEPRFVPGLTDEKAAVAAALRSPLAGPSLGDLAQGRRTVGISICDATRPFPLRMVLPTLLDELAGREITLFVATGSHRPCSQAELTEMLGSEGLAGVGIVQHDAGRADRHRRVATLPDTGAPAEVEAEFLAQDLRITLGLIEPHFFAGFSGGPKMVAPGLASLDTILELHSPSRMSHPSATWGITEGNPVHDAIRHVAAAADVHFALEVTINRNRQITGVFSGSPAAVHPLGCASVRRTAMSAATAPYDVVVTTNGGYPLDQNLYQTVKGMSAAAQIVKPGGAILAVSECSDGYPNHGGYLEILKAYPGPRAFLDALPGLASYQDLWQIQVQAQIQARARVLLHARGLTGPEIRDGWLEPAEDIADTLDMLLADAGPGARLAVLPEGPYVIPYLV